MRHACTDSFNVWYDPRATVPPQGAEFGGCKLMRPGCTNSYASNYEVSADTDDGTCSLIGCTNPLAPNYKSWAVIDDGLCEVGALGCTNSYALNYEPRATADSGRCQIIGCMESFALNFDPYATTMGTACIDPPK